MMETLPAWIAVPAGLLLIIGGACALIGAIGMVRMREFYQRMHPATMGATLGTGCILVCTLLLSSAVAGKLVIHPLVITMFVVVTAPVSAITLMRAAISRTRTDTRRSDN
jgi:multicomponent K+:H+ antiporter subunit G